MKGTQKHRGAAAVELAVVLPLLAVMFAGVVDFARVYRAGQVLESAANAGAKYASGTALAEGPRATAAADAAVLEGACLTPPLRADQVAVTVAGGRATVTVTYDFPLFATAVVAGQNVAVRRTVSLNVAPRPGD